MPITIEKIPGEPILVVYAQQAEGDTAQDMADVITQITRALDEQTEKVFLVTDLRELALTLDDIIQAANMSARGQSALLHHPNIRENIYVLSDGMIKMAVKGLDSATFGLIKTRIFDTVEDALEYCRDVIRQGGA